MCERFYTFQFYGVLSVVLKCLDAAYAYMLKHCFGSAKECIVNIVKLTYMDVQTHSVSCFSSLALSAHAHFRNADHL